MNKPNMGSKDVILCFLRYMKSTVVLLRAWKGGDTGRGTQLFAICYARVKIFLFVEMFTVSD